MVCWGCPIDFFHKLPTQEGILGRGYVNHQEFKDDRPKVFLCTLEGLIFPFGASDAFMKPTKDV